MSAVTQPQNEDAAVLLRVRNRIADTPDSNLPNVLHKLLPRLLSRFPVSTPDVEAEADPNLAGIFEHIRERVLLNPNALLRPEWVSSLLEATLPTTTGGWVKYQYTLPVLEHALVNCEVENSLSKIICILEDIHDQSLIHFSSSNPRGRHGNEAGRETLRIAWERASWMVIEQIAKKSNVPPVLDWNYVGDQFDDLVASTTTKKVEEFAPTTEERSAAKDGLYSLFLDFIVFDPRNRALDSSRWQFRRQVQSMREDYEQFGQQQRAERDLIQRSTDRRRNLVLGNNHQSRRSNPTLWGEAELRYWRALQKCGQPYAIQLFASNQQKDDREDLLRILTGKKKEVTSSSPYKRPKASDMYKVNLRKQSAKRIQEQTKLVCRHDITVGNALLHILLGDQYARRTIQAAQPEPRHLTIVTALPFGKQREPLSTAMAQRVFGYLLRADLIIDQIQESYSRELEVFLELLKGINGLPTLQLQISNEIYERIGAQTPPPMCWATRFLGKVFSQATSDGNMQATTSLLSNRSWDAATQLLGQLQDVSVQRFERERRLANTRQSHDRLIYENREKQALQSPFVAEALEARSEAYRLIAKAITPERISTREFATGRTQVSWDVAVRLLNCAAFDLNKETLPALQKACISVLSTYQHTLSVMNHSDSQTTPVSPINVLLLPLLKACISKSDWSREFLLQWTTEVLAQVDPGISRVIVNCLASDEIPAIAERARKILQQLPSLKGGFSESLPSESSTLLDLKNTADRDAVKADLDNRVAALMETHTVLSKNAARFMLEHFKFDLENALTASAEELGVVLSSFGYVEKPSGSDMGIDSPDSAVCGVCFEDMAEGEGFKLNCQHRFCMGCWQDGVAACAGSRDLVTFSCLQHDCSVRATQDDILKIDTTIGPQLEQALLDYFVVSDKHYTFCPGPDCTFLARSKAADGQGREIRCSGCKTSYCDQCGNEPHSPATCTATRKYKSSADRVAAHQDSVENKTIACPGCGFGITKNGGCNHMTCTNCLQEFCWICLSPNWQDHVCNVFDDLTGVDDLERIQFFSRRVDAHLAACHQAEGLLQMFNEHSTFLYDQNRFYEESDIEILKKAWQTLVIGRKYLANSYIAAYSMSEIDAETKQDFETHQSQLQVFIEQLSLLSDSVERISEIRTQRDFQRRFKGIHFCSVAVMGLIERVDCFMRKIVRQNLLESDSNDV